MGVGIAIAVVVLVTPFVVELARQWWRDRQRARVAAGGVKVHAVRAWPGRDRELARPGQLLLRGDEVWWYDPVTPQGVQLTGVTVVDIDERPRRLLDRFQDGPPMAVEAVASGSALSIEARWESDLEVELARRRPNNTSRSTSPSVTRQPDHEYSVQGLPWWGWVVPAVGAVLIGAFLLLSSLGSHTTGTVVASTDDGVSTVIWTDPSIGAQHQDTVHSRGTDTYDSAPDAVGAEVPILVWPAPFDGMAWNEESMHIGLSVAGAALVITVLASWAVVATRRRTARLSRSLPDLVGTVPATAFGELAAELGVDGQDHELDGEVDPDSTVWSRESQSTWTPITTRLARRAAAEDWDGTPGSWPTRGRLLRRALLAAIVPLLFTLGAAAFLTDAVQGAVLLNGQPTTTQQTVVIDLDAGLPLLDSCLLTPADPAGPELSAPCSGLDKGAEVTVQALIIPQTTLFGTSPARILEPAGHDTTQRSIILLGLTAAICLGVLLGTLVRRLRPLWAQGRAVKHARDRGCDLRYARVQHIDEEVLLLFNRVGEVDPRWAIDLAAPLPSEVPLTGHLRLAGPVQPGGWAPTPDTWSVPIIAERPLWSASRLHELEPDEVTDLLLGPGDVLAELAHDAHKN